MQSTPTDGPLVVAIDSSTTATKAIVVDRRTRLKEQDLILVLLAEDGSEKSVVAKGALKPGGRLAPKPSPA